MDWTWSTAGPTAFTSMDMLAVDTICRPAVSRMLFWDGLPAAAPPPPAADWEATPGGAVVGAGLGAAVGAGAGVAAITGGPEGPPGLAPAGPGGPEGPASPAAPVGAGNGGDAGWTIVPPFPAP